MNLDVLKTASPFKHISEAPAIEKMSEGSLQMGFFRSDVLMRYRNSILTDANTDMKCIPGRSQSKL